MPKQKDEEVVKDRPLWFRMLRWALIISNVPAVYYFGTIVGNLITYVGQSPDGFYALLNFTGVANQMLLLHFLPYWKKNPIVGTLIILQIPASIVGGRWAWRSRTHDEEVAERVQLRRELDRDMDERVRRLRLELRQDVREEVEQEIRQKVISEIILVILLIDAEKMPERERRKELDDES